MANKKSYGGYYRETFSFNGKRIYVKAKTQQELREKVIKKKLELENNEQNLYNPTLNMYYEHFTKVRRTQVRESTIRAQKYQYENISNVIMSNNESFGCMRIKDITRRDIEYVRQELLNNGKSPENLNICFAHLNHVFNNAVLDDTILKNPCKALKRLKRNTAPVVETKHRALTIEETNKFFEEAEKRNSIYINAFRLMIRTGIRVGELGALYKTDIDKHDGFIYIRRTVTRDETGSYYIGSDAKTISGVRDIPLTSDMIAILNKQEELNRILFGFKWSGLIFKSADGEILREYTLNREIKRICKDAGIEYFTCHAFRDTFATRFIEQRPQDYKVLSEILGHKNISITLDLYTHVMKENKVSAMNDILINVV